MVDGERVIMEGVLFFDDREKAIFLKSGSKTNVRIKQFAYHLRANSRISKSYCRTKISVNLAIVMFLKNTRGREQATELIGANILLAKDFISRAVVIKKRQACVK